MLQIQGVINRNFTTSICATYLYK